MKRIRADELLRLPVRLHGVQLGRPVELLLDRDASRVLGLEIVCGDEVHRFLPLPTAAITADALTISSPLVLLEEDELAFYRKRAFALASLRGRPVEQNGTVIGTLADVVVGTDGTLTEVILEPDGAAGRRVPFDETVRFQPGSRSAA